MAKSIEQDIREKLRGSGYTLTSQRRAVLEALREYNGHPSAEEVYIAVKRKNPRIALGTVYQALSVLEKIGLIEAKHWSGSPALYDLNIRPHHDIRCISCGNVSEVPGVDLGDLDQTVQRNTPYEVKSAALVLEGVCPACQKRERFK